MEKAKRLVAMAINSGNGCICLELFKVTDQQLDTLVNLVKKGKIREKEKLLRSIPIENYQNISVDLFEAIYL